MMKESEMRDEKQEEFLEKTWEIHISYLFKLVYNIYKYVHAYVFL